MTTQTDPGEAADISAAKRKLILHDALTFLSLATVTVLLFMVTLFLFRSFAAHRSELATRWAGRGEVALNAGRPELAIVDLRTALSYAPGQRSYELLLARALGNAGHTEEAYNYFIGLWDTQPGDGFINLELARLAAKKKDAEAAVRYYRASIYGTWEGDGILRRREVRLELARYLLAQRDFSTARTELLIAGGNAPANAALDTTLANLLRQAGDNANALAYYQKAIAIKPHDPAALEDAGRIAFDLGSYARAQRFLQKALRELPTTPSNTPARRAAIGYLLNASGRILAMEPSQRLSAAERVSRILTIRSLARKRLAACASQLAAMGQQPSALQALNAQWLAPGASLSRSALLRDPDQQDATIQFAYGTEIVASQYCGAPTGDDALLLALAKSPQGYTP